MNQFLQIKITEKDKKILPIFGIILVLFIFYYFIYQPKQLEIAALEIEYQEKTTLLNQQRKDIQDMQAWKNRPEKITSIADFLKEINELAKNQQLKIQSFNPQVPANTDNKLLPKAFDITMEGDYYALESFLSAWEKEIQSAVLTYVEIIPIKNTSLLQIKLIVKIIF